MHKGSCLCGAVTYATDATPLGASFCHCSQCRTQSGGVWSSVHVPTETLEISGPVKWFHASDTAKRGFCPECGSFLFWKAHDEDMISFSLGSLPSPTGITLERHIFTADKGDYYDIADGLPQARTS